MLFFFFKDTATTEIYTLSLHDALPILLVPAVLAVAFLLLPLAGLVIRAPWGELGPQLTSPAVGQALRLSLVSATRSEEHTSELQSRQYLVCRLLLEKKKKHLHQLMLSL